MNNINQKNVILKLKQTAAMPYRNAEHVNQYSECENITYVDVNNAARQLLDNDLYIENSLNSMSSYAVGPKTSDNMSDKPDGYKAYGDIATSDTLDILHKIDDKLSSTIVNPAGGEHVFVTVWRGVTFTGRNGKNLTYSREPSEGTFHELPITATNFYQDDDRLVFSASDGVYQLSSRIEDDERSADYGKTFYGVFALNSEPIFDIRSVYVNADGGQITVGSGTNVYQGRYESAVSEEKLVQSVVFESQYFYDDERGVTTQAVRGIGGTGQRTIACTENGVFEPRHATVFKNQRLLYRYDQQTKTEDNYNVLAYFNRRMYVGSDNGLFVIDGGQITDPGFSGGSISGKVVDIRVTGQLMYVATESCIYSVSRDLTRSADYLASALPQNRIPTGAKVIRICQIQDRIFFCTTAGLYCFEPSDVVYINEVCVDGGVHPLPFDSGDKRFTGLTDICEKDGHVFIGSDTGITRFELGDGLYQETKTIQKMTRYSDVYGSTLDSGVIKLLQSDATDGVYAVTRESICNTGDMSRRWTVPEDDETINDAALASVSGIMCVLVVTNRTFYVLKTGTPPRKWGEQIVRTPGLAVAANGQTVVIMKENGDLIYAYNGFDNITKGQFKEFAGCGAKKLTQCNGGIYMISDSGAAQNVVTGDDPSRTNLYAGETMSDYGWSTKQNGYFFLTDGKVTLQRFEHTYEDAEEHGEGMQPEFQLSVRVCDVVEWYSDPDPELTATCIYVDDSRNTLYVGTPSKMKKASLVDGSGNPVSEPVFADCTTTDPTGFGGINCICKGYTKDSEDCDAYEYGSYKALITASSGTTELNANISDNESVFAGCRNGLFELKGSSAKFKKIAETEFVAMSASKRVFVGIGTDGSVYSCANGYRSEEKTAPEGIKPGTESDPVVYTANLVSSDFELRPHGISVPDGYRMVRVVDADTTQYVYIGGGKNPILLNRIASDSVGTFVFDLQVYGYFQDQVDVNSFRTPSEKQDSQPYHTETRTYTETYPPSTGGRYVERTVSYTVSQTYDPMPYLLSAESCDGYVLFADKGVYVNDETNVRLAVQPVKAASGENIARAVDFCATTTDLIMVCGEGEGLQSLNGNFALTSLVADAVRYANGNCFVRKPDGVWHYQQLATLGDMPSSASFESFVSLERIFQSAGAKPDDDAYYVCGVDGVTYVATPFAGVMRIGYFMNDVPSVAILEVPEQLRNANVFSLNPMSKSDGVQVVTLRDQSETGMKKYQVHSYRPKLGESVLNTYLVEDTDETTGETVRTDVSDFNHAVFADRNGSSTLYIVDRLGGLRYTSTNVFKPSPATTDGFYDVRHIVEKSGTTFFAKDKYVFRFNGVGDGIVWALLSRTGAVNRIVRSGDGKCLLAAADGIWMYRVVETDGENGERAVEGEVVQLKHVDDGVDAIAAYVYDGKERYLYTSLDRTYKSDNYRLWKQFLQWDRLADGRKTNVSRIFGIYRLNENTYLAACDNGLYMTKYSYKVVHDTQSFTKAAALSVYEELFQTRISADVSCLISAHVSSDTGDHTADSLITRVNTQYLNTRLDNITDWSSSELCNDIQDQNYVDVRNDIINEMYFGEYADGDVTVSVQNYLHTDGAVTPTDITYIMKRWRSGVTELYINVPTTSSYYLANCFGAANCRHDPSDAYSRKNLERFGSELAVQDSTLSTHCTFVDVGIASASYAIDNMLEVQINGMSLPLAVYKDQTSNGDTGFAGGVYRSYIEPSVVRGYDISKTDDDGNYLFSFACFGTDAQAIRLMFYDQKSRTGTDCVKVVFDPNGGDGKMPNQKFVIVPDVNGDTIFEQKNLRRCSFYNMSSGHQKIFAGWSVRPLADNQSPTYEDKTLFPGYFSGMTFADLVDELGDSRRTQPFVKNEEVRLYAVWLDYQFSNTDTTLMMESDQSNFYIDRVEIDPSTKLKDKVIINFGD